MIHSKTDLLLAEQYEKKILKEFVDTEPVDAPAAPATPTKPATPDRPSKPSPGWIPKRRPGVNPRPKGGDSMEMNDDIRNFLARVMARKGL